MTKIIQTAEEVTVYTEKGSYLARSVMICIPPQMIPSIHYEPPLPPDLYRAFSSMQSGNAMKVQAIYEKPFWREKGLSGNGISYNKSPTFTYDNSGPDGIPGVLLGFITATKATIMNQWSREKRIETILSTWAKDWNGYLEGALYAGEQAALECIHL